MEKSESPAPEDLASLPPSWAVTQFDFSTTDTDAQLTVMCRDKRFVICLSAENFARSPQTVEKYLFYLRVVARFKHEGHTVEDFFEWAGRPLTPLFEKTPLPEVTTDKKLESYLFPVSEIVTLRCGSDGVVFPAPYEGSKNKSPDFGVDLPDAESDGPWPCFDPADIIMVEDRQPGDHTPSHPSKVRVSDGSIAFFKQMRYGEKSFLKTELVRYRKIHDAQLDKALRISRLQGVVRREGKVYGLLLTHIECNRVTLSTAAQSKTATPELRQKWDKQVRETVEQLHRASIVWGDAKPDNVLVDGSKDAWVVDFGGGHTEPWTNRELSDTVQGDLQALEKMTRWLVEGEQIEQEQD